MEKSRMVSLYFKFFLVIFVMAIPVSIGQLTPTENRIMFQVQKLLEYPEVLQGWTNWTNFCYLPSSPSLKIVCSNNHVTELTVIGNQSSPARSPPKPTSGKSSVSQQALSGNFNIDAFFTALAKLSNLQVLSLVSLGLWGSLPSKINRFWSLEVLNISSNFILGEIPKEIVSLKNLRSIVFADNLFNGSVPDLQNLVLLEELNLGGNHFGPEFPSLNKNIVSIILRNNSFRSDIPSGLKNFDQLKEFDISSNKFAGPIQSFLFSLPSIQYLILGENQLTGALPGSISCSAELKFVDISHNLLIGKLPSCIGSNSSNRTVISSWNCLSDGKMKYQHPNSFCHTEALAVKPPVKSDDDQKSTVNASLILGVIGGVVGFVVVFGLLILVIIRRSETAGAGDGEYERSAADKKSVRSSPKPAFDSRRVPQRMRSAAIGLPPYRVFSLEEIEDATNNFDPRNLIGEGSKEQLYKAWLADGSVVLVKCLKLKQKQLPQSLVQHAELLSKLRHRHLVSILGHCIVTYQDHPNSGSTIFIVLEQISNGSLQDYLTDGKKKDMLKWPQRMAIIIGATRGIQFLHMGIAPGIFGNNLNLENILLDETLTAKLGGYNIPLPSQIGSASNHPEDAEKEDIYQLGVILLQVITGKLIKSTSEVDVLKHQLEMCLRETPSEIRDQADPCLRGTYTYDSLKTTVEITVTCLSNNAANRPSIEDVLWNLQYSIQVQEDWTSSGNLNTM